MQRYIAFLRAINVGGHNVKMADLRALFEALEFASVETFIASGNVIFETSSADSSALERTIERQLRQALGYEVATFLRTPAELAGIVGDLPFTPDEVAAAHTLSVGFLGTAPTAQARQKLLGLATPIDAFELRGRELYWLCRTRISESRITGAQIEKSVGMAATLRNLTTVRKLAAKYPA